MIWSDSTPRKHGAKPFKALVCIKRPERFLQVFASLSPVVFFDLRPLMSPRCSLSQTVLFKPFDGTLKVTVIPQRASLVGTVQVLTPEEFVLAGDTLVATCPTWSWQVLCFPTFICVWMSARE